LEYYVLSEFGSWSVVLRLLADPCNGCPFYMKTDESDDMKIKVEGEKIINAVKKLDGIEIVLETPDDAREAFSLILRKSELFSSDDYSKLKDFEVNSSTKYETSAVNYKLIFLLEFHFEEDISLDQRVAVIKKLQEFFEKV
jgi:hypothetical protein